MKLKKLEKALSVLLAVSMCAGMLTPVAFADPGKGGGPGQHPRPTPTPTAAPSPSPSANLNETVYVYLNVGEGTVTDDEVPAMPSFEVPDDSIVQAVENAKAELEAAESNKPVFSGTAPDASAVSSTPVFSGEDEATVTAKMEQAKKNLEQTKAALEEELGENGDLGKAMADAQAKVDAADAAITAAETKKADLEKSLNAGLAALDKPTEEEKPTLAENSTEEQYQQYLKDLKAYNDRITAYNDACEALQEEYANAEEALAAETKKAYDAKHDAEDEITAVQGALDNYNAAVEAYNALKSQAPADMDAYNSAAVDYNGKVDAFNTAAGTYNGDVNAYNSAAVEFNNSTDVTSYNDKVQDYTNAKNTYDTKFGDYQNAVKKYDEVALDWNTDKTTKNDNAVIDALLGKNEDGTTKSLLDSTYLKDAEGKPITVNEADRKLFDAVNNKTTSVESLTDEQIAQYNAVVKAYNAAVDNYNANARTDLVGDKATEKNGLLQQDDRFKDQSGRYHSETDKEVNLWYTVGKIDVGNVFGDKTPGEIQDAYNKDSGEDYSNKDTVLRDVYYWDKGEDGTWTGSPANPDKPLPSQTADTITSALGNADKLSHYQGGKDEKIDLSDASVKWVLKVSEAANGYEGETVKNEKSQLCYHLDGYLKVNKLAKLAELAKVPEKKTYDPEAQISVAPVATVAPIDGSVKKEELKWTAPETLDTKNDWNVTAPQFNGLKLDQEIVIPTTPVETVRPTTTPRPEPTSTPSASVSPEPTTSVSPEPTGTPVPTDTPTPTVMPTSTPAPSEEVVVPPVNIPLDETPTEVEVPDVDIPLDEIEVPDEEIPMNDVPEEFEIEDGEIPMADVPQTGDISAMWYAVALSSALGLLAVAALERKQRKDSLRSSLRRAQWP